MSAKRRQVVDWAPSPLEPAETLRTTNNPLAEIDHGLEAPGDKPSEELLYEVVMKSGGEPFGAPFESGLMSLTSRIVRFFRQRSFFGFETLERMRPKNLQNKFTRYGASPYRGKHDYTGARKAIKRHVEASKPKKKGWFW